MVYIHTPSVCAGQHNIMRRRPEMVFSFPQLQMDEKQSKAGGVSVRAAEEAQEEPHSAVGKMGKFGGYEV